MLTNLKKPSPIFCVSLFSNIEKSILTIFKKPSTIFCLSPFFKYYESCTHHYCYNHKRFLLFLLLYIRINGKSINFNNKNIKKSDFYNKSKKIFDIDDIDVNKILLSKKEQDGQYNSFKQFILGIMIMVLLDHYIYFFQKLLATLINLIIIK